MKTPKPPKGFRTCPFCGKPIIVKITAGTFNAKAICRGVCEENAKEDKNG